MAEQLGFLVLSDHYAALSAAGDPLERLVAAMDCQVFGWPPMAALWRRVRDRGGRPPFDPMTIFTVLVLQAPYSFSHEFPTKLP
ncbi:hypothetical protein Ga0102493_111005 [Erythrobacter litoralis]|uniref:Uncharacterized protein n=1 Tax=Erythrobacter litoralis TaxID=39960 RepID=A0A074NGC4_9SPHN|nr:hypothetical protein Ga0102493_111005 [Erythrobacter litoralis]KEO96652.1 hypothetical protein EH32_10530 [Erythrobacter litoralis]